VPFDKEEQCFQSLRGKGNEIPVAEQGALRRVREGVAESELAR
jgi:hypothetical protein